MKNKKELNPKQQKMQLSVKITLAIVCIVCIFSFSFTACVLVKTSNAEALPNLTEPVISTLFTVLITVNAAVTAWCFVFFVLGLIAPRAKNKDSERMPDTSDKEKNNTDECEL